MATDIDVKSMTTHNDANDLTFNQLLGINNEGVIAGYFGSGQVVNGTLHPNKGYTLNPPYGQGNFVNENFPGSVQTQVTGINNGDRTVGFWVDGNCDNFGFVDHDGKFTNVVDPNSKGQDNGLTFDQLLGVNDQNTAVGFWTDKNGNNHGFTYNVNSGSYSEVNIAGFASTTTTAINNEGHIAGFVVGANKNDVSFIKDGNNLEWLTGPKGAVSVMALGINDKDQVVGSYTDATGQMHGFLFNKKSDSYTTIDDPNGVKGPTGMTVLNGINDKGQIVGFYLDSAGNTDGLLVQVSGHHH
jgi:probable HAF family extracellular repeat protein